jgi:hypothetical protein
MPEIAYSVNEARRQMGGIGLTKFYEEVNAGRLKVKKAGGRTVVPAAEIEAWLAALPDYQQPDTANSDKTTPEPSPVSAA